MAAVATGGPVRKLHKGMLANGAHHVKLGGALYEPRLRAAPAAQRPIPQGDQRVPLRWRAENYAAFRSVVSTAKANYALVLETVRFVILAKFHMTPSPRGGLAITIISPGGSLGTAPGRL